VNVLENSHEHVLQQVFRILPVRDHPIDIADQRLAPGLNERAKRIVIATACFLEQCEFLFSRDLWLSRHGYFSLW